MRHRPAAAMAAAALVFAACEGTTTGPDDQDTLDARAEAIALFIADFDATGGAAYGLNMDPQTGSRTFTLTAPCPAGGTRSVSGSSSATFDQETRVLSTNWTTTQAHDGCSFNHARNGNNITVVIDGSVTAEGSASWQLPAESRAPRSLLSHTSTKKGSTTTTAGERSRTCEIDVTQSWNAATGTFTISGVVCGREVNATRTPPKPGGR